MAIDTRDKRDSVIGIMLPFRMRLPVADGSINLADRQHVALLYRGIAVTTAESAVGGGVTLGVLIHIIGTRSVHVQTQTQGARVITPTQNVQVRQ